MVERIWKVSPQTRLEFSSEKRVGGKSLDRYDYIVVGGGSAGCVSAARLVREFGARVLLLEAGPPDAHRLIDMPAGFVKLLFRPSPFVTVYESEPQPSLDGRPSRSCKATCSAAEVRSMR